MGTMGAPAKPEFRVVLVAPGRAITPQGAMSKVKLVLLEDQKLVLIYANAQNQPAREMYDITSASFSGDNAKFITQGGQEVVFTKASCNCGMGVVAYAGITADGREILTKVRPPEWVTGL